MKLEYMYIYSLKRENYTDMVERGMENGKLFNLESMYINPKDLNSNRIFEFMHKIGPTLQYIMAQMHKIQLPFVLSKPIKELGKKSKH
jgi:hypothetical protein